MLITVAYTEDKHYYRPPTKFWEGSVFTGVCHSVQGGKESLVTGSFLGVQDIPEGRGGRVVYLGLYPTPSGVMLSASERYASYWTAFLSVYGIGLTHNMVHSYPSYIYK